MEVTSSFLVLLSECQRVLTAPTFPTFVRLMCGWVLSHRCRFMTDLIWSSGSTRRGHHSKYHRFFNICPSKPVSSENRLPGLPIFSPWPGDGRATSHPPAKTTRSDPAKPPTRVLKRKYYAQKVRNLNLGVTP